LVKRLQLHYYRLLHLKLFSSSY